MKMTTLIFRAILVVTSTMASQLVGAAGVLTEVVKALVKPALQILADKPAPLKDRQQKLRELVSANFDVIAMSRSALGRHWTDLTDLQRADFIRTFTVFLRDSYLSRIQSYSGQQVNFRGQTQIAAANYEVRTAVDQPGGKASIEVNYTVRQDQGKWLIYDVTVANISIAANYRNQFNRVINNHGFDAPLADLKRNNRRSDSSSAPHMDVTRSLNFGVHRG